MPQSGNGYMIFMDDLDRILVTANLGGSKEHVDSGCEVRCDATVILHAFWQRFR